jgi:hypothetical protein
MYIYIVHVRSDLIDQLGQSLEGLCNIMVVRWGVV